MNAQVIEIRRQIPHNISDEKLGYRWKDLNLLFTAFQHSSWIRTDRRSMGLESNERFEFIGDAVVDLIVGAKLMRDNPQRDEGWLSQRRADIVRKHSMANFARVLSLGEMLLVGNGGEYLRTQVGVLADTMEALVGAAFLDGGLDAAVKVCQKAGIV